MVFPIFFPCGDLGWSIGYKKNNNNTKKDYITALQYYLYRLSYRPNEKNFSPILFGGRLTQQFFIHAYIIIESNRMNFLRNNQKQLRIECYQGLLDHVQNSACNNSRNFEEKERLGNLFILPSTYIGSPRYMQQHYQDAMAIVRAKGRPDLFITVTCNPKWTEITNILQNFPIGTTPNDIPNLTVRLFYLKFKSILSDIVDKKIFGEVLAYVYTIEFKKRGLPHAHLVVTLHQKNKLLSPELIDSHISAEIPKSNEDGVQKLVIKHMLHGPHSSKSPCYIENKKLCKQKFPKHFCNTTIFSKDGYPKYRRRDNSNEKYKYLTKKGQPLTLVDNSMVVPYNKFLLKKYKCHINVEYCASIQSIKYLFDYLHKGNDRAFCKIKKISTEKDQNSDKIHDEIHQYIDGRYLSPMEAAWRLQEFEICGRSHTVVQLAVHTENQQKLVFEENKEEEALNRWETTLTAWFKLNKVDEFARRIQYINIPKYYVRNAQNKLWVRRIRVRKNDAIGRMSAVSPKDSERFHLKLILSRVTGATSFNDLRFY